MTYVILRTKLLLLLVLAILPLGLSLTNSGCDSTPKLLSYDEDTTTLQDVFLASGSQFVAPVDGMFVPFDRWVHLLHCEDACYVD